MNKLDFGATFSKVFDLYSKHAAPLLMWAAAVQVVIALVMAVMFTAILGGANVGAAIVLVALGIAIAFVASFILSGAYIVGLDEVERGGAFPAFGDAWAKVKVRLGALIVTSLIAGIGILIGAILLIIPALVLMTWWAIAAPVVMLEDKTGFDALGRSRELVRGNGWTVFGLIVVVNLVAGIASNIIGGIVGAVLGGSETFLGMFGSQFVSGTLIAPISALLSVVIYHSLRSDGSDLDMMEPPMSAPQEPSTPQPPSDGPTSSGPFV